MECIPILPPHFQQYYNELMPKISDYSWMWNLLRRRAQKTGWFPRRLHAVIQRFGNPAKPYFVGQTSDGIRFLGDYRDEYSATCEVCPDYDGLLLRFMQKRMQRTDGAYVDIGSNMGVTVATMARFLQGRAEVLAFEPVDETARRAVATFALNNLDNVRLYQVAIGNRNEEISFFCGAWPLGVGFSKQDGAEASHPMGGDQGALPYARQPHAGGCHRTGGAAQGRC